MPTTKPAGAACPSCHAQVCAEYQQIGQPAQWTCHECNATGLLTGSLSIRSASAPEPVKPAAGPRVLPANRNLSKVG